MALKNPMESVYPHPFQLSEKIGQPFRGRAQMHAHRRLIAALTQDSSVPEGAWCVRHHGRGHQDKPEQKSGDAGRKYHRHDHQKFDKDKRSSDLPTELGVVPQFDPEQAQSRNQHQQSPGH